MTGGLAFTGKMPCPSYSLSIDGCRVGRIMRGAAGSVCSMCYGAKGNYRWPSVRLSQSRREASIPGENWVEAMVTLIRNECRLRGVGVFRWHDSGDFRDEDHLDKVLQVIKGSPEIGHWLPTQDIDLVRKVPDVPNVTIRVSSAYPGIPRTDHRFQASTVGDERTLQRLGAHVCDATRKEGDKKCGACRKCWDRRVKLIGYLPH